MINVCRLTVLLVLAAPLLVHAQNDPGWPQPGSAGNTSAANSQTTPGIARSPSGTMDASTNTSGSVDVGLMKDKMFLRRATMNSLAEVDFGQIAIQKGSTEEVKKLATKMVADHTALMASLRPFAQGMGVSLPTSINRMDKAEEDKLNSLTGPEFDKEFLAYLAQDHHRDLKTFKAEAESTADPDLKDAVVKGQMTIAEHSRALDKLAAATGVPPDTATRP